MRIRQALVSSAVSTMLSVAMAPPAVAQSFIQKLLGIESTDKPRPIMRSQNRTIPAYRFQNRPRQYWRREQSQHDEDIGPPDSGGPYKTVCVRACDGYYFPLRSGAWRRNFVADVKSCRSACGDEARLFYHAASVDGPDHMLDLAGRKYSELPNAFAYRKALVQGCSCKPAPWSPQEVQRHQSYAQAEQSVADVNTMTAGETAQLSELDETAAPEQQDSPARKARRLYSVRPVHSVRAVRYVPMKYRTNTRYPISVRRVPR